MNRREAVKSVAFLIGGALSATTMATLFDSCTNPGKSNANLFTPEHQKLVTEIARLNNNKEKVIDFFRNNKDRFEINKQKVIEVLKVVNQDYHYFESLI